MRILVAMLGARLHYLTPRTIAEAGMLEAFHTDLCATKGTGRLVSAITPAGRGPRGLRRLMGRVPNGIPSERIVTHESIGWRYALRRTRPMTARQAADLHLSVGREFCARVLDHGFGNADSVLVYNTAALEISREAKRRGLRVMQEQTIAPKITELQLLAEEFHRFPDIQHARQDDAAWQETIERELEEVRIADLVFAGSEFVKRSLVEHGVDPARVRIVANTCDYPPIEGNPRAGRPREPLRVLFAGEVGLRKGAHYLIEAMRSLRGEGVVARLAGTVAFTREFASQIPDNVELLGPVPRTEMCRQFEWADVFCLPSLCEGSPIAICEALASGLPVITTPHADSLIEDGYNGRVVPIRDADAIARAIRSLAEPELRQEMGLRTSRETPPRYSFDAYRRNLIAAITQ